MPEKPVEQPPCPTQSLIQWLAGCCSLGNLPWELLGRTGLQGPSSCLKPLVPLPLEMLGWDRLVSLAWGRAGGIWLFPVSTPELRRQAHGLN